MKIKKIIAFNNKRIIVKVLQGFSFILLFLAISIPIAFALKNPAYVYCTELGYNNIVNETSRGSVDYCQFPDGSSADAWNFLKGKVAQEFSYCKKEGYGIKTVQDSVICQRLFTEECAVCILSNGTEVEVTQLMNLSLKEGVCGDGGCTIGETYLNCPQDCTSGGLDGVCDGVKDGICDPDCVRLRTPEQDTDCLVSTTTTTTPGGKPSRTIYIYLVFVGIIIAIIIIYF